MPNNKSCGNRLVVPEARQALEQMKLEIASELGMPNYDKMDKGNLTSRENGYVGGNITRNLVAMAQEQLGQTGAGETTEDVVKPDKGSSGVNKIK